MTEHTFRAILRVFPVIIHAVQPMFSAKRGERRDKPLPRACICNHLRKSVRSRVSSEADEQFSVVFCSSSTSNVLQSNNQTMTSSSSESRNSRRQHTLNSKSTTLWNWRGALSRAMPQPRLCGSNGRIVVGLGVGVTYMKLIYIYTIWASSGNLSMA